MSAPNSRRIAAFIVARWLATKDFPSAMLPEGRDRAFVQDLAYTTIRRLRPLRKTLGALMRQWPKGELEALLYVGAAQVLYMPDVPDFAAVSATVDAAKMCENRSVAKVVNGVLRNLVRRRAEFEKAIAESPLEERESFPTALVRRWEARFGTDGAARLCAWHNEPAETFLARKDGSFTKLERGCRVEDVEGYAEGAFIVQDPGTRLAIELLDPKSGERVLDVGTGSGILSICASKLGAKDIYAYDIDPVAVRVAKENALADGCDNITVGVSDLLKDVDRREPYGICVANIVADIILRMLPDIGALLLPGAPLILSGIIAPRKEDVIAAAAAVGFFVEREETENDWVALLVRREA